MKIALKILIAALVAIAAPAFAQSSYNFYYGFKPTADQWDSYFAQKLDYKANGIYLNILGFGPLTQPLLLTRGVASGVGPGAGMVSIQAVCGTSSGTAKIIAYAGTSSTPSTIVDNVGGGVSGC